MRIQIKSVGSLLWTDCFYNQRCSIQKAIHDRKLVLKIIFWHLGRKLSNVFVLQLWTPELDPPEPTLKTKIVRLMCCTDSCSPGEVEARWYKHQLIYAHIWIFKLTECGLLSRTIAIFLRSAVPACQRPSQSGCLTVNILHWRKGCGDLLWDCSHSSLLHVCSSALVAKSIGWGQ